MKPVELFRKLFEPFADSMKATKKIKGQQITFVEWYHYITRAWDTFPEGFHTRIVSVNEIGKVWGSKDEKGGEKVTDDRQLLLVVEVEDHLSGIKHQATGTAPVRKDKAMYGGAAAEAESQALRRAFAKFGLGLEMYMDEEEKEERTTPASKAQINRMRQLVSLIPEDKTYDPLREVLETEREAVSQALDKEFRTGLAIEILERAMLEAGLDVPDPS